MKARNQYNTLSRDQKQIINREVRRRVFAEHLKGGANFDALVLWTLHKHFGFGKDRLRKFFDAFLDEYKDLKEYYELDGDTAYVAVEGLKAIGVDVYAWEGINEKEV